MMRIGERVALYRHDQFLRYLVITEQGLPSGMGDHLACYKTNEGSLFYVKNELWTSRHYNPGNRAFYIVRIPYPFIGSPEL